MMMNGQRWREVLICWTGMGLSLQRGDSCFDRPLPTCVPPTTTPTLTLIPPRTPTRLRFFGTVRHRCMRPICRRRPVCSRWTVLPTRGFDRPVGRRIASRRRRLTLDTGRPSSTAATCRLSPGWCHGLGEGLGSGRRWSTITRHTPRQTASPLRAALRSRRSRPTCRRWTVCGPGECCRERKRFN